MMRVAAVMFIKLLERFPRLEITAYLLVFVIGGKLCADWEFNTQEHPHRLDFHSVYSPTFWIFWLLMLACILVGFIPKRAPSRAILTSRRLSRQREKRSCAATEQSRGWRLSPARNASRAAVDSGHW